MAGRLEKSAERFGDTRCNDAIPLLDVESPMITHLDFIPPPLCRTEKAIVTGVERRLIDAPQACEQQLESKGIFPVELAGLGGGVG